MPEAPTPTNPTTAGVAPTPATPPATPAPVTEPATGNEQLGETGLRALQDERTNRKALEKQLAEVTQKLTTLEQRDLSELDKAKAASEQLATDLAKASAERDRLVVAAEHGIPKDYHHLLTASSPEALAEQAKTVAQLVASTATPAFAPNPGQGTPQGPPPTLAGQIGAAEQSGDMQLANALRAQQLLNLRTATP